MTTKVGPTGDPPKVESASASKGNSASSNASYFSASSIVSMTATVGIGFFRCVTFVIVQGFYLLSRCTGKKTTVDYQPPTFPKKNYELSRYNDFTECFEQDPAQGLDKMLDLLDESPNVLKAIILDAVTKSGRWSRRDIISKVEEAFFGLLASPEVLFHGNRVIMQDFSGKETLWLTGNDDTWDPKGKDIEVITTRRLQKEYEDTKEAGYQMWKKCFGVIKSFVELSTLKLLNKSEYVGEGEVDIKLGDFIERLHFMIGFGVLTAHEERFDPLMTGILNVLGYLNNESEFNLRPYPQFQALVKKAHRLLQKPKNQNALFEIAQAIIEKQSPSPEKRRASNKRY